MSHSEPATPPQSRKSVFNALTKKVASETKKVAAKTKSFANQSFDFDTKTAKQAIVEKLGKAKKTESVDIKEKVKLIDEIDDHMPKIYRAVRKETDTIKDLSQASDHVAEGYTNWLAKLSVQLNQYHTDWQLLNEFMTRFVELEQNLAQEKSKLNLVLAEDVVTPLSDYCKTEIHQAKEAKSKWSQARMAYDASVAKLESERKKPKSTKVKDYEVESSVLKATFEDIDRKTSTRLAKTIDICELLLIRSTCEYVNSYKEYFEAGLNLINGMEAELTEMQNHYAKKKQSVLKRTDDSPKPSPKKPENQDHDVENEDTLDDDVLLDSSDDEHQAAQKQNADKFFGEEVTLIAPGKSDVSVPVTSVEPSVPVVQVEAQPKEEKDTPSEPVVVEEAKPLDVGQTLQQIMEAENQRLEREWEMQQQAKELLMELELNNDNKLMTYDFKGDMKYGSKLYEYLMKKMTNDFVPEIISKFKEVQIPPFEETVDAGKLGEFSFGLGEVVMNEVIIPLDAVSCTFDATVITIVWNKITARLSKFSWHYKKETFPKLKDNGNAESSIADSVICVNLLLDVSERRPRLKVTACSMKVGELDIKISGTAASLIYNMILGAFSTTMKRKLQDELTQVIHSYFAKNTAGLLSEFVNEE